jgi:hypothetical protein
MLQEFEKHGDTYTQQLPGQYVILTRSPANVETVCKTRFKGASIFRLSRDAGVSLLLPRVRNRRRSGGQLSPSDRPRRPCIGWTRVDEIASHVKVSGKYKQLPPEHDIESLPFLMLRISYLPKPSPDRISIETPIGTLRSWRCMSSPSS